MTCRGRARPVPRQDGAARLDARLAERWLKSDACAPSSSTPTPSPPRSATCSAPTRCSPMPEARDAYAHDDAEWAEFHRPLAVVLAESTDDVAAVVRFAARAGIPVVPRGAGTGLSGGANAVEGSIVVSLERMTRVLDLDVAERVVVAEAGRHQRRPAPGGRRRGPLVSARPGELQDLDDRRQRRRPTPAASAASSTASRATTSSA